MVRSTCMTWRPQAPLLTLAISSSTFLGEEEGAKSRGEERRGAELRGENRRGFELRGVEQLRMGA